LALKLSVLVHFGSYFDVAASKGAESTPPPEKIQEQWGSQSNIEGPTLFPVNLHPVVHTRKQALHIHRVRKNGAT